MAEPDHVLVTSDHPVDLASGVMVAPGDTFAVSRLRRSKKDEEPTHDDNLIEDGALILIDKPREVEAEEGSVEGTTDNPEPESTTPEDQTGGKTSGTTGKGGKS